MRTFVAIELNQKTKDKLCSLENELKKMGLDVKWVKPENIHITLQFLGGIPSVDINKIETAVKTATNGFNKFRITFVQMGCFPNNKNPRVIWVGIAEGKDDIIKLSKAIGQELIPYGFIPEEREFIPHLTIGRVKSKKNIKELAQKIETHKNTDFGEGIVDKVLIMESKLSSQGPTYLVLKEVRFK